MLKGKFKKIVSTFLLVAMAFTLVANGVSSTANAATRTDWKFDFGGGGTASGYTGVSSTDNYTTSKGYGFNTTQNVKNVNAVGSGALSDGVQFTSTNTTNTFNVDLDNGLYQLTIHLGNTTRTSIWAEGVLQIINMTGNNAVDSIQIPITDGQLNIMATEGKAGYPFTISALEIKKISNDPTMKQTIWICGDSTVCNYYPLDTSIQAGCGQLANQFVDKTTFQIRNMAASGQYAKGFVDSGQFAPIQKYGKKGDYYIISIGINDTNYSTVAEYYKVITDMTKKAKSLGMKVILVKQQGRAGDISRSPLLSGRWFGSTLDTIGIEQGVQVVDLFKLAQDYFLSIGQKATTDLYMPGDTLHPNRKGATKLAELITSSIKFEVLNEVPVIPDKPKLAPGVYGDLDGNTKVNVFDYIMLKKYISGTITTFPAVSGLTAADVNGDTKVNVFDYIMMKKYISGTITTFPVGIYFEVNTGKVISQTPTIYLMGDSTVSSYNASAYPQTGWGQVINQFFAKNVKIDNRARAGRSSKMFINEGTWDIIYNLLQPGDYVFIQFGINDANYNNKDRYTPVSDGTFQNCISTFVEGALKKDVTPILFTTVIGLGSYSNGKFVNSYAEYCQAMKDVAAKYKINCIDLNSLMVQHYNSIGYNNAYYYHMISSSEGATDKTHFTQAGATAVAKIIAEQIKKIDTNISQYVLK